MANKELGWSAARLNAVRFLALTLSVSSVALALTTHTAYAVDQKKARDKVVDLNKQALLSYEAKDFETAKNLLTKALKEAKEAGLDDDKMTARTYLHLGAVYWVGFQDQALALQNFTLAKKIRPDIQLTPSIETADLKSVFDLAVVEPEQAPAPAPAPPPPPVRAQPQPRAAAPRLSGDESGEPDLPATMSSPLMCAVPDVVPPGRELSIRCALKPGLSAKVVQLHHRAPGVEAYQVLAMHKTAKGWYLATLPGHMMKPGDLQVYFDARDANDKEIASNGQVDSPTIIEIRKKGGGKVAEGECSADDPMCNINKGAIADAYEAGLHRRRAGAIWLGVGAGMGWGFSPAGKLEWEQQIQVSAITTTTGIFHLLPEVGWMYSDTFALALQARVEFIKQQQGTWEDPNGSGTPQLITPAWISGAPTNMAFAVFGRAIWYTDLSEGGNFQFSYSGDIGGGYIRFPVLPSNITNKNDPNHNDLNFDATDGTYSPKPSAAIARTDTRPVGPFLVGAGAGLIYHLSRNFAFSLDGRALTGLPAFGILIEGSLSAQVAFGGSKGPAPASEEGEGEGGEGGGPGPGNDAPAPDESSSSDDGE